MIRSVDLARLFAALILAATASACAQETIVHQITENEAIRVLNLLSKEGVEASKVKDTESRELAFNIVVAKEDEQRANDILVRHNLPEPKRESTADLFREGGMIPTSEQERAKREVGVAGDIMNSLRRVPRVVDASALVSIPEDNPLRDVNEAKPKPKASVIVAYLPDEKNLPPIAVEDVQRFVQAALPELRSTEVSVQMIPMGKLMNGAMAAGEPLDGGAPPAAMLANACEKARVIGIDVCSDHRKKLLNSLLGVVVVALVLSTMSVVAVLRALRYRKDLTRLTAQVAQLKR